MEVHKTCLGARSLRITSSQYCCANQDLTSPHLRSAIFMHDTNTDDAAVALVLCSQVRKAGSQSWALK